VDITYLGYDGEWKLPRGRNKMAVIVDTVAQEAGSILAGTLGNDASAPLSQQSAEQFAASQMEMTRTWYNNLLRSGHNVEEYIAKRKSAYVVRWREAGRYFSRGDRVLDVGGGNMFPEQFEYFRSMDWDYWYADIGETEVQHSAQLAASLGFDPSHFSRRLNNELHYEEAAFDAVFSSHCIEHSMEMLVTMRQLNRILKKGGNLVISIPFGWDAQPNHPYFLMENEWMTLLEDAGFRIRAYQIGDEYPENGQDLMIAAEKVGPVADHFRLDVARYIKTSYRYRNFRDPSVRLVGESVDRDDHIIMQGGDWRIEIALEAGVTEVLPVFNRHSWSGTVAVRSGADAVYGDLFRPRLATHPLRLTLSAPAQAGQVVEITPVGKNELSVSTQGVFVGYMMR
jgi:SAM-dependent methyltransferase